MRRAALPSTAGESTRSGDRRSRSGARCPAATLRARSMHKTSARVNMTIRALIKSALRREKVAQLARALFGPFDRRPVAAFRQDDDARAFRRVQLLGKGAHLLRRRDAVFVAG